MKSNLYFHASPIRPSIDARSRSVKSRGRSTKGVAVPEIEGAAAAAVGVHVLEIFIGIATGPNDGDLVPRARFTNIENDAVVAVAADPVGDSVPEKRVSHPHVIIATISRRNA